MRPGVRPGKFAPAGPQQSFLRAHCAASTASGAGALIVPRRAQRRRPLSLPADGLPQRRLSLARPAHLHLGFPLRSSWRPALRAPHSLLHSPLAFTAAFSLGSLCLLVAHVCFPCYSSARAHCTASSPRCPGGCASPRQNCSLTSCMVSAVLGESAPPPCSCLPGSPFPVCVRRLTQRSLVRSWLCARLSSSRCVAPPSPGPCL